MNNPNQGVAPDHVIIRGHVFTYKEKSPFVASGKSLLGAVEYDSTGEKVKCHECGVWIRGLGTHIKVHRLKRAEYNAKHGLRAGSALSSIATRNKHTQKSLGQSHSALLASKDRRRPRGPGAKSAEWINERSRCKAQLLFRIQVLAATIGHTPRHSDLREAGISPAAINSRFGGVGTSSAMKLAGLAPNDCGYSANPIPKDFPPVSEIEKKWNERMPWPEDYFVVDPLEQRGARGKP